MRLLDPRESASAWRASTTRPGRWASRCGSASRRAATSGIMPLDIALDVAEELGLPVMAHLDHPPPARHEVMTPAAARRRADPLLPAVSQSRRCAPTAGPRGDPGGARARRDLRYRPWRRLVRLRHDQEDAGGGLPARRHLVRRARGSRSTDRPSTCSPPCRSSSAWASTCRP